MLNYMQKYAFVLGYMNKIAREANISYSCAMLYLEDADGRVLSQWEQDMKEMEIAEEDLHKYGREKEPHITILYGIHTGSDNKVRRALEGMDLTEMHAQLGDLDIFENDDYDVLIRKVKTSKDLKRVRERLDESLKTTITFPEYKPHATIAYLKKGKGKEYLKKFKGRKFALDSGFDCSTVHFSDKGAKHYKISLKDIMDKEAKSKSWKEHYLDKVTQCSTKKCKKVADEAVLWADGRGSTAKCSACMKKWEGEGDKEIVSRLSLQNEKEAAVTLDLEIGDVVLTGRYKNKRKVVTELGTDELGQPTVNGQKLLACRIEKKLPKPKWSSKSLEELKKSS